MNQKLFLIAVCLWFAGTANAQPRHLTKATQLSLKFPAVEADITRALTARVNETYRKLVWQMQHTTPGQQFSKPLRINPEDIYPGVSFLTTREQLELYFIARNNRAAQQMLTAAWNQLHTIQNNKRAFYDSCQTPDALPEQIPAWLAGQIPQKADYLFLGEQHKVAQIKQTVTSFLPELKKRFSNRPVILFTEFLPEHHRWTGTQDNLPHKYHFPIWQAAGQAGIPVIGLEPQFVLDNSSVHLTSSLSDNSENIWASLEGAHIRNIRWATTLAEYRKKYPDALFVIYCGGAHTWYSEPHSLGQLLQHLNTFVVSLHNQIPSFFDILTDETFADKTVVQPSNKKFSFVAGFDIQIKLPNQP